MLLSGKRRRCLFETHISLMAETSEGLADIMLLVRLWFTMSPSTEACERGFSAMNAIKNICRMRKSGETEHKHCITNTMLHNQQNDSGPTSKGKM